MSRYWKAFSPALGIAMAMTIISWAAQSNTARGLTETEQRGRQIYLQGIGRAGRQITAVLGSGDTELPGTALACAECHGTSGLGNSEGGATPSNLTWESLTRPYEVSTPSGRKHGPYTEASLKRAVTTGLDPAGNMLELTMPRFRISSDDAEALVAYLKRLGHIMDPGLTDSAIRVGAILPAQGQLAEIGQDARAALEAYLDDLNERGGIYGRKLELRTLTIDPAPRPAGSIGGQDVFAAISTLVAAPENDIQASFERENVPLIAPFGNQAQPGMTTNKSIFYIYSGPSDQARALCHFAAKSLNATALGLVIPSQGPLADLSTLVRRTCDALNLKVVIETALPTAQGDSDTVARRLSDAGAAAVLVYGPAGRAAELAAAAARIGWRPNILLIGSLAGPGLFDIPAAFQGKVFAAYPTLPSEWSPDRLQMFAAIAEKHHLSPKHMASQIAAITAAEIFVEGLRRTGRELSREKFVDQLERLYRYDTGLSHTITFRPDRHVGAPGAYVVVVNSAGKQLEPAGAWIPLD